jgi:hypothetical protein
MRGMKMNVRVVTKEVEREITLDLGAGASDSEILRTAERALDTNLNGLIVSRKEDNILLSPAPIFG